MVNWILILGFVLLTGCGATSPVVHLEYMEKRTVGVETKLTGGMGTGFFVSRSGYIVTAAHVVRPTYVLGKVYVRLSGPLGSRQLAKVIAVDYTNDIALLKISSSWGHSAMKFCERPKTNEWVQIEAFRRPSREKTMGVVEGHFGDNLYKFYMNAVVDYGFSGSPVYSPTRDCVVGVLQAMHVGSDPGGRIEMISIGRHPGVSKIIMDALRQRAPESLPETLR